MLLELESEELVSISSIAVNEYQSDPCFEVPVWPRESSLSRGALLFCLLLLLLVPFVSSIIKDCETIARSMCLQLFTIKETLLRRHQHLLNTSNPRQHWSIAIVCRETVGLLPKNADCCLLAIQFWFCFSHSFCYSLCYSCCCCCLLLQWWHTFEQSSSCNDQRKQGKIVLRSNEFCSIYSIHNGVLLL